MAKWTWTITALFWGVVAWGDFGRWLDTDGDEFLWAGVLTTCASAGSAWLAAAAWRQWWRTWA